MVLYFLAAFLFLGVGIYFIAQKSAPEQNPVFFVNEFLIYYFGIELLIRYFVQNLPITDYQTAVESNRSLKTKSSKGSCCGPWARSFNWIPTGHFGPFLHCVLPRTNRPPTPLWIWVIGSAVYFGDQ